MVRGAGGRWKGGFEGVEIKGGKINNVVQGNDAGLEKTVSVGLNINGGRKVGVGKRREGGGLMEGDEGLKEASVVIGEATVEVAEEVPLSVVCGKVEKKDEVEDRATVNDDDGGVGEGCKHEGKNSGMGLSMICISSGGANGGGENVGHEVMWPGGVGGPGGGIGIDGEECSCSNGGVSTGVVGAIRGKDDG